MKNKRESERLQERRTEGRNEKYYTTHGFILHYMDCSTYLRTVTIDCYALTSSEIIIVIFEKRGRRASSRSLQYTTRLMHLRNCFAQRLESDSVVSGFCTLVPRQTWIAGATNAHNHSAPR